MHCYVIYNQSTPSVVLLYTIRQTVALPAPQLRGIVYAELRSKYFHWPSAGASSRSSQLHTMLAVKARA